MEVINFKRRSFFKTSAGMLAGTLASTSATLALLAPSTSWSMQLETLDSDTGKALLRATRHIFPHATLDDAVYALVVKDLDGAAKSDPKVAELLKSGVAELNKRSGGDWMSLGMGDQFPIIRRLSDTDFFQKIRGTAVVSLYNNEMAFAHFGYEGSSVEQGGYFNRGFQDLDWLPAPDDKASPAKD